MMRGRQFARRAFLQLHRTIGLFVGAVFVLIGLSGSILAFREDVDEWLNASTMRVETPSQATPRPLDEIFAAALAQMPPEGKVERLTAPRHAGAAASIAYLVETDDLDSYFYEMFVDPYTAKVTGQRVSLHGDSVLSQPLVQIVAAFHWTLLLGVDNAYIIGAVGILAFVSILVGLYLWWPLHGDWRSGLTIKRAASRERIVYDLHKSVGAYFAVLLSVMLITGVAMIFKPATRSVVSLLSPVRPDPDFGRSTPIPGRSPIGLGEAVARANEVFPQGRLHWILMPSSANGVYVVGKQADDEPNRTKTYRNVGVDRYNGEVLHVQDRRTFTAGETFVEWLFPLHSGEAFGKAGRLLVLLIGAAPALLYVTGFLRWLQKRRARRPAG